MYMIHMQPIHLWTLYYDSFNYYCYKLFIIIIILREPGVHVSGVEPAATVQHRGHPVLLLQEHQALQCLRPAQGGTTETHAALLRYCNVHLRGNWARK